MTSHRIYTVIASAAAGAALLSGATALSPTAQATTVTTGELYTVIAYSPITGYTGWANDATTLEEGSLFLARLHVPQLNRRAPPVPRGQRLTVRAQGHAQNRR